MTAIETVRDIAAERVRRAWELFKLETDSAGKAGLTVQLFDADRRSNLPRHLVLKIEEGKRRS